MVGTGHAGSFERLFGELENQLFSRPVGALEKLRPIGRALSAIERHRRETSDLARRLPPVMIISGAELAVILDEDGNRWWRWEWVKWLKPARPLKLGEIVGTALDRQLARRARLDRAFEAVLTQVGLHLLAAWQVYRRYQLAALAGGNQSNAGLASEQKWWSRSATALVRRTEHMVFAHLQWVEISPGFLVWAVLRGGAELSRRGREKLIRRWDGEFGVWHRQRVAVDELIALERQFSALAREMAQASREAVESLRVEHDDVTKEMA